MRQLEILIIVLIIIVGVVLVAIGVVKNLDQHEVGLTNLEEFKTSADPNDLDSDGIIDALDRGPAVASNLCSGLGSDITFENVTVTDGNTVTCGVSSSIAVHSSIVVKTGGSLELLAPKVQFLPGFVLPHGGVMNLHSVGPGVH